MSCHRPRVAITGIGVVSPFGVGRDRVLGSRLARRERHARDHRSSTRRSLHVAACAAARCRDEVELATRPTIRATVTTRQRHGRERQRPRRSAPLREGLAHRRARRARGAAGRRARPTAIPTSASSSAAAPAASTSPSGSTASSSPARSIACRRTRFPSRSSASSRARSRSRSGCAASATCCRPAARARPTRSATRRR